MIFYSTHLMTNTFVQYRLSWAMIMQIGNIAALIYNHVEIYLQSLLQYASHDEHTCGIFPIISIRCSNPMHCYLQYASHNTFDIAQLCLSSAIYLHCTIMLIISYSIPNHSTTMLIMSNAIPIHCTTMLIISNLIAMHC